MLNKLIRSQKTQIPYNKKNINLILKFLAKVFTSQKFKVVSRGPGLFLRQFTNYSVIAKMKLPNYTLEIFHKIHNSDGKIKLTVECSVDKGNFTNGDKFLEMFDNNVKIIEKLFKT